MRWHATGDDDFGDEDSCFHQLAPLSCAAKTDGKALRLQFDTPHRAATPGQAVVLYGPVESCTHGQTHDHDTVVAAATIAAIGPTVQETGGKVKTT